jgi:chemotaxis protein CheX
MNLKQFLADSMNRSVREVFSTMLGVELPPGTASFEDTKADANCEVFSFVGLAGAWVGAGSLNCSADMACRMCSCMLMTEAPSVNEEVLDAVAELTNMIVGNVKTELEGRLGPLGLSIPTVVYGRNFKTKTAGAADWVVLSFLWDDSHLIVKLCLAPHAPDTRNPIHLLEGVDALPA